MERTKLELHSVWDHWRRPGAAGDTGAANSGEGSPGGISTCQMGPANDRPWIIWGDESHALAVSVTFDGLREGADLDDSNVAGEGDALGVVRRQLLTAGIRLAFLLDQSFAQ